jgi:hypothetical protein
MNAEACKMRAALRRPEPGRFRGRHLKEKAQMREITTGATAALVAALLGVNRRWVCTPIGALTAWIVRR